MRDSVRRCKETFLRVQAFGRECFAMAEPTSFVRMRLVVLDSVITGLDSYASAQAAALSAARQGTIAKDAALSKLLRTLEAISRTARPMEAADPTLLQQFRVPHGQSVQGVLAAAVSAVAAARQLQAEFILRGLPTASSMSSRLTSLRCATPSHATSRTAARTSPPRPPSRSCAGAG